MILISEKYIKNVNFRFYRGMDFDLAINHPNDGSGDFLVFFVENWEKEIISHSRNSKIESLINNKKYDDLFEIDNDYIYIYQTGGMDFEEVYKIVLSKLERTYDVPWVPIAGIKRKVKV
jgi:hypothetical protein